MTWHILSFLFTRLLISSILITNIFFTGESNASFSNCPAKISSVAQKGLSFLTTLPQQFTLGACTIELHTCGDHAGSATDSLVGDMLILDRNGRPYYFPLDFYEDETLLTQRLILNGRRMFHYEYSDQIMDSLSGRTETYRLEIVKSSDLAKIKRVELGVYRSTAGNHWVICE